MINLSYLKKLKKRLHDTTAHFQVKGEKDTDIDGKPITDERRVFYFNLAKYGNLKIYDTYISNKKFQSWKISVFRDTTNNNKITIKKRNFQKSFKLFFSKSKYLI